MDIWSLLMCASLFLSAAASCEELHCGHKRKCAIKEGKPLCSLKTKICSAWGDSYYHTFDGRDFVLQGNCNYTLVQTACPGLNASVPLQINIARAYLNSPTVSTIHTVQISIQGFNISIVKEDRDHVRVSELNLLKLNIHFLKLVIYIVCSCMLSCRLTDSRGTCPSPWEMGP